MNFLTVNFVPPDKISRVNIAALRIKGQVHRRAVRSCVDKYFGSKFRVDIHCGLRGWLPSDQVGWDAKVHNLVKTQSWMTYTRKHIAYLSPSSQLISSLCQHCIYIYLYYNLSRKYIIECCLVNVNLHFDNCFLLFTLFQFLYHIIILFVLLFFFIELNLQGLSICVIHKITQI